ncbi:MAG TPA: hypothetical protein VF881_05030 [Polyangiaceae bacterium]
MAQQASTGEDTPTKFEGELRAPPRGALLTAVLALTGILLITEIGRLIGRYVLTFRRPTEVRLTETGLEIHGRTLMLGKLLRENTTVIPREGLVRVSREVRYPSLAMYAGLIALALGSYLGVGLVVDGVRAASPSMLGTGFLIALLGLGLDFAFSSLVPGIAGQSRVVLVPRRGPVVCIASVNPALADRLLAQLSRPDSVPSANSSAAVESSGGTDGAADKPESNGAGDTG